MSASIKALPNSPLWEFSVKLYRHKEVADACLYLQDQHQLNVNVLLLCCWTAATGRGQLATAELQDITHRLAHWQQQITQPLRALRRSLAKKQADNLKALCLKKELVSENIEQLLMTNYLYKIEQDNQTDIDKLHALCQSLRHYFQLNNTKVTHKISNYCLQLLQPLFPSFNDEELAEFCQPRLTLN